MKKPESDHSLDAIVAATRERGLEQARQVRRKVAEAREEALRLVAEFRGLDPDLDKVVLFGSLTTGRIRSGGFDIDLAVKSRRFLQLVACGLRSHFRVDVVDLDQVAPHVRASIERDGEVLYEKHQE